MINRELITSLDHLDTLLSPELPFDSFPVFCGKEDRRHQVCTVKALIRLDRADQPLPPKTQELYRSLTVSNEYVVRVYVLRALNLVSSDRDGRVDAYLQLNLGHQKQDTRSRHLKNVVSADFHELFEFRTRLPGDSLLRIKVRRAHRAGAPEPLLAPPRPPSQLRPPTPTHPPLTPTRAPGYRLRRAGHPQR